MVTHHSLLSGSEATSDEESGVTALSQGQTDVTLSFAVQKFRNGTPTNDYDLIVAFEDSTSTSPSIINWVLATGGRTSTSARILINPSPDSGNVTCRWSVKVRGL